MASMAAQGLHQAPPPQGPGYKPYRVATKDRIYRRGGYSDEGYTYYPAVIVGAGESGICMAHKLKHEFGIDQFRVFDRQSGIGGTWYINRYPGVACDVPAVFYSFSFAPNPNWTVFYPTGPEIYDYYQEVCDKFKLTDKIQLNTDVVSCRWLKDEEEWEIVLQHLVPGAGDLSGSDRRKRIDKLGELSVYIGQEKIRSKVLISAVGGLVEPKDLGDIPGKDTFKGDRFHSARWDYSVDFHDKNVVVVGTGCSAAQFVPFLTKPQFGAKSVTQVMRSPPWVVPRVPTPGGEEWWAKWAPFIFTNVPGVMKALRFAVFAGAELQFVIFGSDAKSERARKVMEEQMVKRMKSQAPAKYHEMLTPNYAIACKRRIYDATWYPSFHNPKMELTTLPITSIQENSITLGPGRMYPDQNIASSVTSEEKTIPVDIIVQANGFETHQWLHPLKIAGDNGQDLIDTMMERGGSQAYQGTAMDGFPNFFMIFGPNTATGHSSVVMASENMVDYAGRFVKLLLNGDVKTVDVKKEAEIAYTTDIQKKLKNTVFHTGGCSSWYFSKDGWNSTVLPYNQVWFWYRCQFTRWGDWNIRYTRKGLIKMILKRGIRFVLMIAVLIGLYRARRSDTTMRDRLTAAKYISIGGTVALLDKAKQAVMNLV
ncbi:FAD/NAD(P)-binding domain-containing protein [Microthyrium microscopicum]|uniref:FAD/NAD(P)-binding domain-containing protein n=1 Tax=Microthyrium microscopicum TaxID=703497 RepID=A0A6A6U707_9PEZI|nr:FAD/NAD(P)-binding domain-containing protein [Microthyrium microscopicum]